MSLKIKSFTLIEVMIALAILSLAVVSLTLLAGAAVRRTGRAAMRWEHTHLLTQAVEFFMLNEPESKCDIDERFFPLDNYSVECSCEEPSGLPENVDSEFSGLRLTAMKIVIRDRDGKTLDSAIIERITGGIEK
ncbi:MAG: prepilin-type N-terminal cleavage/methylation domain-containing protein [Victivallales bacterium]|nr:prepilin-type N-terminal cleavage/methylation domain-containing protein [Victivallales bacterium]